MLSVSHHNQYSNKDQAMRQSRVGFIIKPYFTSRSSTSTYVLFALLSLFICSKSTATDFSAVGLSKTRILIESDERSSSFTLTNDSSDTITYRMRFQEIGLDDNGRMIIFDSANLPENHLSSASIIRFSPRQISLAAGESQVVRVIARRKPSLPAGEYRSHLNIQALPIIGDDVLRELSGFSKDLAVMNASSPTKVGITIPVIVRNKTTSVAIGVDSITYPVGKDGLIRSARVKFNRTGDRSVYGSLELRDDKNRSNLLGNISGYAIYHPYTESTISIPLKKPVRTKTIPKKVEITFINHEDGKDNGDVIVRDSQAPKIVR